MSDLVESWRNAREKRTVLAMKCAGNALCKALEAKDKRIAELEKEHGDMNVQNVKDEKRIAELEGALDRALKEWKAWMDLSDGGDFQASNDDDREIFAHCSLALKPDWQEPQPFEVDK